MKSHAALPKNSRGRNCALVLLAKASERFLTNYRVDQVMVLARVGVSEPHSKYSTRARPLPRKPICDSNIEPVSLPSKVCEPVA